MYVSERMVVSYSGDSCRKCHMGGFDRSCSDVAEPCGLESHPGHISERDVYGGGTYSYEYSYQHTRRWSCASGNACTSTELSSSSSSAGNINGCPSAQYRRHVACMRRACYRSVYWRSNYRHSGHRGSIWVLDTHPCPMNIMRREHLSSLSSHFSIYTASFPHLFALPFLPHNYRFIPAVFYHPVTSLRPGTQGEFL